MRYTGQQTAEQRKAIANNPPDILLTDAAFFHLYGIARDDVDYVMETFPIVKRNDEKAHGEYRTKRVILEIYDAMSDAVRSGQAYASRLDPPPSDPRIAHPQESRRNS